MNNPNSDPIGKPSNDNESLDEGYLYKNPGAALKAIRDDYFYWTENLTKNSFTLSITIIAANWAVFGSVDHIMINLWSKLSILLVVLCLALNLAGAKILGELHRKRIEYAENDPKRWHNEFIQTKGTNSNWPSTRAIDRIAIWLRGLKTWLPLSSGAIFFIALFAE
jgi:hypothetical protein